MRDSHYQISDRFRKAVEARIEKLERDADEDLRMIPLLAHEGHQKRQKLLVMTQIEQAVQLRARLSLSDSYAGDSLTSGFEAFV